MAEEREKEQRGEREGDEVFDRDGGGKKFIASAPCRRVLSLKSAAISGCRGGSAALVIFAWKFHKGPRCFFFSNGARRAAALLFYVVVGFSL